MLEYVAGILYCRSYKSFYRPFKRLSYDPPSNRVWAATDHSFIALRNVDLTTTGHTAQARSRCCSNAANGMKNTFYARHVTVASTVPSTILVRNRSVAGSIAVFDSCPLRTVTLLFAVSSLCVANTTVLNVPIFF